MNPSLATPVFIALIAGLFYLDYDRRARTSPALWIPVIWVFIGASRMVTQWFGGGSHLDSPDQYLEGSPIDASLLAVLLTSGLAVLYSRGKRTAAFLRSNQLVLLFFAYCAISAIWSDFPLVAFKRWTKALGNVTMVAIVLTESNIPAAVRRFFARAGFPLIMLSVLCIKFYPHLGRGYSRWTWTPFYTGVSTEKNQLGVLCLVFGLASFWRLVESWKLTGHEKTRRLAAHGVTLIAVLWLFQKADSSTSIACFLLGSGLIIIASRAGRNQMFLIRATLGGLALFGLCAALFQDFYLSFVNSLGRDGTLTGRTEIWSELFRMDLNPILGTGFESFWLGDRAEHFWTKYYFHPNQAHNGYIETYINLGIVGVILLLIQITAGYRSVMRGIRRADPAHALRLALFVVALLYNMTEAAFKVMHPMWIGFLFAISAVPNRVVEPRRFEKAVPPGDKRSADLAAAEWKPQQAHG